ncbi:MAG: hypothetical protein HY695_02455 [Deltaproteobacteria bacterium]|nr:hypothetical protein [Deltaproteobacteria bacterium]
MMKTRRFWGKDTDEALRAVRSALGADALILGSKSVESQSGSGVEVTALEPSGDAAGSPLRKSGEAELTEVRRQLGELKSLLTWLVRSAGQTEVFRELLARGISPDIIAVLAQEIGDMEGNVRRDQVRQVVSRLIRVGGDIECQSKRGDHLAFFGPTGVGKTTTVIKLTVRLLHQGRRRIGWLSVDGHRIASTEPLGAYAAILGVPWEVAENGRDLSPALKRLSGCDLVLVDTAGISPLDNGSLDELARTLREIPNLRRFLVLSAATNSGDMTDWLNLYGRIGFDSIIFTKIDECRHLGHLINVALNCDRPVSYVGTGQSTAGDIELASNEKLAALLLPDPMEYPTSALQESRDDS